MKKEKNNKDMEKELNLVKCPKCNYYNYKGYITKYGKCRGCKTVLNEKADFKYNMIKKLHLFKKGQAGELYKRNAYEEY